MEKEEMKYKEAKKIAKEKTDFIRHLGLYSIVMAVLAAINNALDPGGYQWWVWPATCWGICVVINFLEAFIFVRRNFRRLEEQLVRREMEKMAVEE
jgi:predicted Co/Zn/Cd cation transporter (cation efflux family)